ncbi:MAG: hypothetical protein KDK08_05500 [Rhizobiaceae bacterium]|nr:hypothetical protein [Rhizobiaceae bacterium]MCC0000924.1 hypothetical protein [Methylobacteriaceae bacterium]
MDHAARVTFIQAQVACMMAELEAMKAENRVREIQGLSPTYGEQQFLALQEKYLVSHNAVIEYLRD